MLSNDVPAVYSDALRGIANKTFLQTERYESQQWRANRDGAHPKLLEFSDAMVKRMAEIGVPMFPHCIVRTEADQDAAYALGRSKVKGSDAYPHRFAAVDLIHSVKGWEMPEKAWDLIGHVGHELAKKLSIPITWGGDWEFYDPAHWELAFWRSMEPMPPHMYNARGKLLPEGAR